MSQLLINNSQLSERQKLLLKMVIEYYIQTAEAIGSHLIQSFGFQDISSATIRNEMVALEKKGYISKEHFSSGRIPTKLGYQYYLLNLISDELPSNLNAIKLKLSSILAKRHQNIDECIDESAKLITKFINLPIIVTKFSTEPNVELLKKIDIVHIMENQYMIFFITSASVMHRHFVIIDNEKQTDDIAICIRLFNEKLINLPVSEVANKIEELKINIKKYVHQYEFIFEKLIIQILKSFRTPKKDSSFKIYNQKSLINQPEFQKNILSLEQVMDLLESNSVFSSLAENYLKTGKSLINFENNIDGLSVASTKIENKYSNHQISVVGPMRMNYPLIKYLLQYLHEKLSN